MKMQKKNNMYDIDFIETIQNSKSLSNNKKSLALYKDYLEDPYEFVTSFHTSQDGTVDTYTKPKK